ncbi:MAG: tryptophan synthase subunit alpha [Odoribacter sp.]|nr:tryptophan synthase subunit alpha [Odoribacter sp.]
MNRITELFNRKENNILSVYYTAGYPHLNSSQNIIKELEKAGVDMIEVGVPFSDPMADGVVIQQSSTEALKNGMALALLFEQIKEVKKDCKIPLVLMGYLNPMMQFGIERLFEECSHSGIDGLIVPDLPFHEYMENYKALSEKYDIPVIMLITPETSEERIRLIDENCKGFIYMVSSASTTGVKDRFSEEQIAYFKAIDDMNLVNKRLIGFGVSNALTRNTASQYANGVIVGSLFIKCLAQTSSEAEAVKLLIKKLTD